MTASDQSFLPRATRDRIRSAATPLAVGLGRLGVTPNAITVAGFVVACATAVVCGFGLWLPGSLIHLGGSALDMLDGALARATGRANPLGAFLDSTLDRWSEGVVYSGIVAGAVVAGEPVTATLSALAMSSAFMVSYTRARAEALGFHGEVGVAPRAERVLILGAGLLGAGLGGGLHGGPWLQAALAIIVALATITTVQRIFHVRSQASAGDRAPATPTTKE
jgi:CDP-diacylglycerol--glycerol-3-phosphate 3-phosphatidyltransferase